MNTYYKHMPEDFKKAVEIIQQYCQNEDCDMDCRVCPYPLAEIRCGDVIHHCENCKHYGEDLHGANCRFCQDMELWEVKENG